MPKTKGDNVALVAKQDEAAKIYHKWRSELEIIDQVKNNTKFKAKVKETRDARELVFNEGPLLITKQEVSALIAA